ncbi:putative PEP-binding protein, partial [Streptococcus suis]
DQLSPAFLRVLQQIAEAGKRHNKPVTLCGEMAGKPLTAMMLVGLGFRSISMSAAAIGPVKNMLLSLDAAQLNTVLSDLVQRPDANGSI